MSKKLPIFGGQNPQYRIQPQDVWGEAWEGDEDEENDEDRNPTHRCQTCNTVRYIDDYQLHTPSWCEWCEEVRSHERLDHES